VRIWVRARVGKVVLSDPEVVEEIWGV
jgi:hypothetical protein